MVAGQGVGQGGMETAGIGSTAPGAPTPVAGGQPAVSDDTAPGGAVPSGIVALMGASTFDISKHKVDDFREAARRQEGARMAFKVGKPAGVTLGVAILTKKAAQITARLVLRRTGKVTRFSSPTPEFVEPELQAFLEQVHLVPAVDVTSASPTGHLWPFRVTSWAGYEAVFNAIAGIDDARQGLYLRYARGQDDDPGGYVVNSFDLEPRHLALLGSIPWPNPGDLVSLLPAPAFSDLLNENFNLKLAWAAVQKRRGASL